MSSNEGNNEPDYQNDNNEPIVGNNDPINDRNNPIEDGNIENGPIDEGNDDPINVGNGPKDDGNDPINDGNGPINDGNDHIEDGNAPIDGGNGPIDDVSNDIAIAMALQEEAYAAFEEPMEIGSADEYEGLYINVEDSDDSINSSDSNQNKSVADDKIAANNFENLDVSSSERDRLLQMNTPPDASDLGHSSQEQHNKIEGLQPGSETKTMNPVCTSQTGSPDRLKQCNLCKEPAEDLVCGGCYFVVYCSAEHQLEDWKSHQKPCCFYSLHRGSSIKYQGPFRFRKHLSPDGFRFQMEASCHIPQKTVISEETPFFTAPWPRMKIRLSETTMMHGLRPLCLTCFGCCKMLQFNFKTCCTCNIPLCSDKCPFISKHRNNECHYMKEMQCSIGQPNKFDSRTQGSSLMDEQATELFYMDVMVLRFILHHNKLQEECGDTKKLNEKWAKLTATWKISETKRKIDSKRGQLVSKNMEATLPLSFFATKGNHEVIWYLFCILEENTLIMDLPFRRLKVLCNATINASHSCAPNSHVFLKHDETYDLDNLLMTIISGKPVEPGELITISYCPLILPTVQRQSLIQDQYLFLCRCLRCMDPSECDTSMNSIKCPICGNSYLMPPPALATQQNLLFPPNFKDACYNWTCTNVGRCPSNTNYSPYSNPTSSSSHKAKQSSAVVLPKLERYELESVTVLGCYQKTQRFIRNRSSELHPNNHIFLKLYDDMLKGALFPIVGNYGEHLTEFSFEWLQTLSKAKDAYTAFMKKVCPAFDFQGFPEVNHMVMETEYYKLSENNISSSSVSVSNYFDPDDPRISSILLRPPSAIRPVISGAGLRQFFEIRRPRITSSTSTEPSVTQPRQ